jgi:ligand-binding SRPBCC domain-containing protein
MGHVHHETLIEAPRERVFDLARHVGAHVATMPDEDAESERDLLELGDTVTFRQRQFGLPFELTAEVTEFDRPRRFVDEQRSGVFGSLVHEHTFEEVPDGTRMVDDVHFTMPLGPLGRPAEPLARRRLAWLVAYHAAGLRRLSTGAEWRRFLDG